MSISSKIILMGVEHQGLPLAQDLLSQCRSIFAAKRFMPLLHAFDGTISPITPLKAALNAISLQLQHGNVGVLASGDPLFFGIGKSLIHKFGRDRLEIHPALSSMQLAFSRFKEPWQGCKFISLHGRDLNSLAPLIQGEAIVFLLTDAQNSPDKIANHILAREVELGRSDTTSAYQVFVGENLGLPNEQLHCGDLRKIAANTYGDLNVMIIKQALPKQRATSLGLTEAEISHSRGLITKDEVRAVSLHKLRLPPHGVFWDIGAGSGSISIEAAGMLPNLQIYSIEKKAEELVNIKKNRAEQRAVNLTVVPGNAPESLIGLPAPDRVFIGGNGGMLKEIIEHVYNVLPVNGRIVVNAVIEKTRTEAPPLLHQAGLTVDISEIRVERSIYPTENNRKITFNPISIITGINPVREEEKGLFSVPP